LTDSGLRLIGALQAGDQAGLVTFTNEVSIRADLTSDLAAVRRAFDFRPMAGNTALIDASHTAMVIAEGGTGRPVVIVFSDGADTASFLSDDAVLRTARRTGAVVYAVTTRTAGDQRFFDDLTKATGGERIVIDTPVRLSETFAGILKDVRDRYLLTYSPRGVASAGWHDLVVRTRDRRTEVTARPGYWGGD
jgi:VWFA-related protein